jgi:hypothetical protein
MQNISKMVRRVVEYSIITHTPVIEDEHNATMTPYFHNRYAEHAAGPELLQPDAARQRCSVHRAGFHQHGIAPFL